MTQSPSRPPPAAGVGGSLGRLLFLLTVGPVVVAINLMTMLFVMALPAFPVMAVLVVANDVLHLRGSASNALGFGSIAWLLLVYGWLFTRKPPPEGQGAGCINGAGVLWLRLLRGGLIPSRFLDRRDSRG